MIETTEIFKNSTDNQNILPRLETTGTAGLELLVELGADGASIFRDLDPNIWDECEQNPRQLLVRTSAFRLAQVATDPLYVERVRRLSEALKHTLHQHALRQVLWTRGPSLRRIR